MPLHTTEELKAVPTSQIESESLDDSTQTYVFPDCARNSQAVYQTIHNQLILDGNSQQNLATFCTTWIEPEVKQLMDESADKNMIDKDEYPQTAAIEERCVHMLANLWNSPEAASTIGCSTTGSSEAAMLGGLALKWNWRKRRRAPGKPTEAPNLIMGPVQVCWHKFCRYFDVEIREVPMEGEVGPKEAAPVSAPAASSTLSVNVFTAPGKPMVGERPRPFGEALGFDPTRAYKHRSAPSPVCDTPGLNRNHIENVAD